jgi:hypothetical protein
LDAKFHEEKAKLRVSLCRAEKATAYGRVDHLNFGLALDVSSGKVYHSCSKVAQYFLVVEGFLFWV